MTFSEGSYGGPIEDPIGSTRLALELRTTADIELVAAV